MDGDWFCGTRLDKCSQGVRAAALQALRGGFCTACARRSGTHTLLFGEGACLVWHTHVYESRPRTEKKAKYGKSLSHMEVSGPGVGRLHAVQTPPPNILDKAGPTKGSPLGGRAWYRPHTVSCWVPTGEMPNGVGTWGRSMPTAVCPSIPWGVPSTLPPSWERC